MLRTRACCRTPSRWAARSALRVLRQAVRFCSQRSAGTVAQRALQLSTWRSSWTGSSFHMRCRESDVAADRGCNDVCTLVAEGTVFVCVCSRGLPCMCQADAERTLCTNWSHAHAVGSAL
jgi:hypothetical protein